MADARVVGLPEAITACLFDLDGVLTDTARIHAEAWKTMFDDFLARRGDQRPFDAVEDYDRYVDGRPRYDGVAEFLRSRGPGSRPAARAASATSSASIARARPTRCASTARTSSSPTSRSCSRDPRPSLVSARAVEGSRDGARPRLPCAVGVGLRAVQR